MSDGGLAVQGLCSHYGPVQALFGIDLHVAKGQLVALVGANGAGKTTLLRAISGVQPVSAGVIRLAGRDVTRASPRERVQAGLSQVPEGRQVFAPMTVEDNLRLGAITRSGEESLQSLADVYRLFPVLSDKAQQLAGTLSGGQQQMLAIGRALMARPEVLLLDEPSMGLAPLLVKEIFDVIRTLRDQGRTILLVEQNARAALSVADYAYAVETGRVVLEGTGEKLLASPEVQSAYLGM